ncbi:MAG TPA: sigma-54 dependent transcriptional regulator [Sphingomonas sp.]|nr:sigma-54 dependent transcriptional regulator [Sphingomonas sp.]
MTLLDYPQPVFFVEDDETLRDATVQSLELAGLTVVAFDRADAALKRIDAEFGGVVVTDVRLPGMDGLELFERLRAVDPELPVILITGHADVPMAVSAFRRGAADFIPKPFATERLLSAIDHAAAARRATLDGRRLSAALEGDALDEVLIGESPAMVALRRTIAEIAACDLDVLIEGETGTGKELVASLLHRQSRRRAQPFVAVNCGALSPERADGELFGHALGAGGRLQSGGLVGAAGRGTLLLDEIDSLAKPVQVKLLRLLEEREVLPVGAERPSHADVRVVAATKCDLADGVRDGWFRADLFYRLDIARLRVPPLGERQGDIALLFAHFVDEAKHLLGRDTFTMSDAVRRRLIEHHWPGNVRELRSFAIRCVLGGPDAAPRESSGPVSLADRVAAFEEALIRDALAASCGSIPAAMEALGVPRKTLYDKLKRYGIVPADFR